MGFLDALGHLANLFGAAIGLGLIAPSLAKLLWRQDLKSSPWPDLVQWAVGANVLVTLAGLVLQGRDGRMATYAAMVLASTAVLFWRGWRRKAGG